MLNTHCFWFTKCEDLMLFSVLYDCSLSRLYEAGRQSASLQEAFGDRSSDSASLFTFMSCWLATLPRLMQCQSVSEEAYCGLKRHQNIIVGSGRWVAGQEMRECIHWIPVEMFLCVCVCVSVKASKRRDGSELLLSALFSVVYPFSKHRIIGVKD